MERLLDYVNSWQSNALSEYFNAVSDICLSQCCYAMSCPPSVNSAPRDQVVRALLDGARGNIQHGNAMAALEVGSLRLLPGPVLTEALCDSKELRGFNPFPNKRYLCVFRLTGGFVLIVGARP